MYKFVDSSTSNLVVRALLLRAAHPSSLIATQEMGGGRDPGACLHFGNSAWAVKSDVVSGWTPLPGNAYPGTFDTMTPA